MTNQHSGFAPRSKATPPRIVREHAAPPPAPQPNLPAPRIVDRGVDANNPAQRAAAAELSENLGRMHSLLKQLAEGADAKLAAMRKADAQALHACVAQETELLEHLARNAQERQVILAQVAQHLRPPLRPELRLSDLIETLPEPQASILRARSVALRESAGNLQEKNRLAARVAHHLQTHIRAVFAELAKVTQESVVYGPKGQHEQTGLRSCLDAVG